MKETGPKRRPESVRRSLFLSFAQKYTGLVITLPSIIILSRLLTPKQIGVYSVAAAFVNIVHMLRDFGTSDYLVQAPNLDEDTARTTFTVTVIVAWLLGGLLFLSSPWIAFFFNEKGMALVLKVLSINFVLLPFGTTVNAMLARHMQYGILYKIHTFPQIIQAGATLTLAWFGFGYMSPTWGSVAGMGATILGCMIWGRAYRIRGLGTKNWRSVSRFGIQVTLGDIVGRIGISGPDFVIGRMLGFVDVGLYSRGFGVVRMFKNNVLGAIDPVVFSAFSQQNREGDTPHVLYLRAVTLVSGISWPFMAFSSVMSYPIIRAMFGSQWDGAVPVLRFLAIAALLSVTTMHGTALLTAIGKVSVATRRRMVLQVLRLCVLVGGAFFNLTVIAALAVPNEIVGFIYTYAVLVKHTEITWRGIFQAVRPSAWVLVCSMIIPVIVYYLDTPAADNLWTPLLLSAAGAIPGWVVGLRLANHPLWGELLAVKRRAFNLVRATGTGK